MVEMELKSRQTYILRSLLDTQKGIPSEKLLTKFNISKRTLYYDFEKINDWLKQYDMGTIVINEHHMKANIVDRNAMEQQLKKNSSYFYSVSERRAMEIITIALSAENVTINKLIDSYEVSKNTILMDIKEIKDEMNHWGLTMSSTIKSGYLIMGEEVTVRK
jgi:transcriptional antiterminator